MKKIIKLSSLILINIFGVIALPAYGVIDCGDSTIPDSVREAAGCNPTNADSFPNLIQNIINIIIGVTSFVAVAFIIVGGINYMTSSGDAQKVEKAKKTILYACIGLAICVLAYAIVNWTIGAVS